MTEQATYTSIARGRQTPLSELITTHQDPKSRSILRHNNGTLFSNNNQYTDFFLDNHVLDSYQHGDDTTTESPFLVNSLFSLGFRSTTRVGARAGTTLRKQHTRTQKSEREGWEGDGGMK